MIVCWYCTAVTARPASASAHVPGSTSSAVTARPAIAASSSTRPSALAATTLRKVPTSSVSSSAAGEATSTECPSDSSVLAAASAARRALGVDLAHPRDGVGAQPDPQRPGIGADDARRTAGPGGGAVYGSPGISPASTSRIAAESRTDRATTWRATSPFHTSPSCGPTDTRPRDGLRPTRPHSLDGMRIEPPPSPAWPTGTSPAATAAADPPLEPPVPRVGSHGLRVAPYACGSVVVCSPNSGVLVLPTMTKPASSSLSKRYELSGAV